MHQNRDLKRVAWFRFSATRFGVFHRFTETANPSISLFLRNFERKVTAKAPKLAAHTFLELLQEGPKPDLGLRSDNPHHFRGTAAAG